MNRRRTPAATKICEAIARFSSSGRRAQAIRVAKATTRAMQKPKRRPEKRNLKPIRRLIWKIVMFMAARARNTTRRTAHTGTSMDRVGLPPS